MEKGIHGPRVVARVCWEDSDRAARDFFFETSDEFSHRLSCDPHPFLVGCILPAMRHSEQRIRIEGEICPLLKANLRTVTRLIRNWYGPQRVAPVIEAKTGSGVDSGSQLGHAASFLTGGIDGLATLRTNRLNVPVSHPASIRECLMVYGMNPESDNRPESFEKAIESLRAVAADANVRLVPVYTNIRELDENIRFFLHEFHGAVLAAAAHACSSGLHMVYIASSADIPHVMPWGSHPLLDESYSSFNLRVRHDGILFSRLKKTRIVSEWDAALHSIKVCTENWPGENCGKCEKCLRTMLALMVMGALEHSQAFLADDVSADQITASVRIKNVLRLAHYQDLLNPLREIGRMDLAKAIEAKIDNYHFQESLKTARIPRLKWWERKIRSKLSALTG